MLYTLLQVALIAAYIPIRLHFTSQLVPSDYAKLDDTDELWRWETQIFGLIGAVLAVRAWTRNTLPGDALATLQMYGKAAVISLAYLIDWRIAAYYTVLVVVLYLIVPQPTYTGPHKFVELTLDELLSGELANSKTQWLVQVYSPLSSRCRQLQPLLSKLSVQYASNTLRFGRLDLTAFPQAAEELQVSRAPNSQQLPTLILYDKSGKEAARMPQLVGSDGIAAVRWSKREVINTFTLDKLAQAPSQASSSKK